MLRYKDSHIFISINILITNQPQSLISILHLSLDSTNQKAFGRAGETGAYFQQLCAIDHQILSETFHLDQMIRKQGISSWYFQSLISGSDTTDDYFLHFPTLWR